MKNNRHGRARVLNQEEFQALFNELNKNPRDACLYAICFFTACRISEALQIETTDITIINVKDGQKKILTLRKATTKGKLSTRTIPVHAILDRYLEAYHPPKAGALFPGQVGRNKYLSRSTADRIFRNACEKLGLTGASTHSCRRSALTLMSKAGIPLREIQEVSGHRDLGTLQRYLEVSPEQVERAVNSIWL